MLDWIMRQWARLSDIGKLATTVTLMSGAVVAVAQALPIIEPYWYVTRGEFRLVMDRQAVAQDRQSIIILKGQLTDAKKDPAAESSPIVKERIRDIEKDLRETTERVQKATTGPSGVMRFPVPNPIC